MIIKCYNYNLHLDYHITTMELFIGIILISMPILFASGLLFFMMSGSKESQNIVSEYPENKE